MPFNLDVEWFMADLVLPRNEPTRRSPWGDERTELLKTLYATGLTYGEIASALGDGMTREAVGGKIHRLGLPLRGYKTPSVDLIARRAAHAERQKNYRIRLYDKGPRKSPTVAKAIEQPVPQCAPVSFMELGDHSCHYPVTDDHPFMFCGADNHGEHSYCGYHYSICYMKPPRSLGRAAEETRRRQMTKMRKGLAA